MSILGTNDAAVITGTSTASRTETNAILTASGTLSATDVDSATTFVVQTNVAGNNAYGTFSIDAAGAWTYTTTTARDAFIAGTTYTDSITVATADGTTQVITVSILGTNDAPTISTVSGTTDLNVAVTEDALGSSLQSDTGNITFDDLDLANTHTVSGIQSVSSNVISFDFMRIDSWDGERFWVKINGTEVLSRSGGMTTWSSLTGQTTTAGYTWDMVSLGDSMQVGGASPTNWIDQKLRVNIYTPGFTSAPTITIGSTLDQDFSDESWAIDNFSYTTNNGSSAIDTFDAAGNGWTYGDSSTPGKVTSFGAWGNVGGLYANGNFNNLTKTLSDYGNNLGSVTSGAIIEAANTSNGTVPWTYQVNNNLIQYLAANQTKTEVFTFTISDPNGGTITQNVTATITGTNDAPVVAAIDVTGAVTELLTAAGNLTDSGTISFTDVDLADVHTVSTVTPSVGALGTLSVVKTTDTTGTGTGGLLTWNYSVAASAVEYLAQGQTKVENFIFDITDNQGGTVGRTVAVTITGTNDAPVITSGITGTVAENAAISTVIYTASATDIDTSNTLTYGLKANTGDVGLLIIDPGTGAVTLKASANYEAKSSYSFTVEATDAGGLKAEKAVVVSVTNVNEAPVFAPSTASITYTDTSATDSFSSSSGTFIATDVDTAPPLTYGIAGGTLSGGVVTKVGSYGTLAVTASTGAYTFTPNNSSINALSTAATENYTVTASDGFLTSNLIYTVNANGVSETAVNGVNFAWYAYAGNWINSQGSALTVTGTSGNISTRSDFYLDDSTLSTVVARSDTVFIRAYASIVIPDIAGSTFELRLATSSDDGVQVWIDKGIGWESVISNRTDHGPTTDYSLPITVPDNSTIPIKVEWWENGGGAVLDVLWSPTSGGAATTRLTGSSLLAIGTATPLILDLNNDGVHTLATDEVVQYDLLGTGTPASVGWSSPEDGFLVFDINNDGIINDGTEMFGEATRLSNGGLASNGFEALIDLDFNLDGVLDLNDPLFSYLQIWKDANSDGITDLDELFSLADQNITSFDVYPQEADRVENGNQIKLVSTYSTADGVQHEIADVWLKVAFNPEVPTPIIG